MDELHFNIRRFREKQSLSQSGMADLLGVSRFAYYKFENGITRLYCRILTKMALAFDCREESIIFNGRESEYLLMEGESHREQIKALTEHYEEMLAEIRAENEHLKEVVSVYKNAMRTINISQLHKND